MEERTAFSPRETISTICDQITAEGRANDKGKRKAESSESELEDDGPKCVICLDSISEKCVATPCRHSYDYVCILNWLELRQSCPLCNALVEGLLVHTEDGKIRKDHVEPPRPTSQPVPHATSSSGISQIALRNRTFTSRRPRRRRSPSPVSEDTALLRRRFIYKHKLRSLYVGSNRLSRFRNVTPRDFHNDEELVSRARMWVRRELRVWEWTSGNAEFLIEYVVGILKSVDLRGSAGQAEEMVSEILGKENAQIFIHELNAFVRSPFTSLQPFDNFVQYKVPIPTSFDLSYGWGGGGGGGGGQEPSASRSQVRSRPPDHNSLPYYREGAIHQDTGHRGCSSNAVSPRAISTTEDASKTRSRRRGREGDV